MFLFARTVKIFVFEQGNSTWIADLCIIGVTAEDVERNYELIARNDVGEEKYTVRISTSSEPEGTRLRLLVPDSLL